MAAIPAMLPANAKTRQQALELINQILGSRGSLSEADKERMQRITRLFIQEQKESTEPTPFRPNRKELQAKTS